MELRLGGINSLVSTAGNLRGFTVDPGVPEPAIRVREESPDPPMEVVEGERKPGLAVVVVPVGVINLATSGDSTGVVLAGSEGKVIQNNEENI